MLTFNEAHTTEISQLLFYNDSNHHEFVSIARTDAYLKKWDVRYLNKPVQMTTPSRNNLSGALLFEDKLLVLNNQGVLKIVNHSNCECVFNLVLVMTFYSDETGNGMR